MDLQNVGKIREATKKKSKSNIPQFVCMLEGRRADAVKPGG
jgi:hypothetical protein